jgi:antitoxin component YwqK of YwqJK toxin-antitoxin module
MGDFFGTLLNSLQARFLGIVTRIRVLLSPSWWKTKGGVALREFFTKIFDFKPRDKGDYYTVLRWLVSKRLAFALVIVIGVASLYYILVLSPAAPGDKAAGNAALPVYRYNSLAIRFFNGLCRIKARADYIAYEGGVEKGIVKGDGRLFDRKGNVVYDGSFDKNMYNGKGKLYYPNGKLKYEGDFINNEMNGTGQFFASSGALHYEGAFLNGRKNGEGDLFNGAANSVFHGNFILDQIAYAEFVGKTAEEAAAMYTGGQDVYVSDEESVLHMKEIGAVGTVTSGEDDLEGEGKVTGVIVLESSFPSDGRTYTKTSEIEALFGKPDYTGYTYCMLSDAVAVNALADKAAPSAPDASASPGSIADSGAPSDAGAFGTVSIDAEDLFEGVYRVDDYDRDVEIYIYAYKTDDVLYTFYCAGPREDGFLMYSIEVGE